MKKNILKVAFVAAIAMATGIQVFNAQKTETLSEVAMANVEALANARQATVCTGFYYVCSSDLDSFLAEKAKNCDIDEVSYAILHDC